MGRQLDQPADRCPCTASKMLFWSFWKAWGKDCHQSGSVWLPPRTIFHDCIPKQQATASVIRQHDCVYCVFHLHVLRRKSFIRRKTHCGFSYCSKWPFLEIFRTSLSGSSDFALFILLDVNGALFGNDLAQGISNLSLEIQSAAEFSFNPDQTHLAVIY